MWKILIIQQIRTRSPESLISVINEGDRGKRFEDIDDDSFLTTIMMTTATMYKRRYRTE